MIWKYFFPVWYLSFDHFAPDWSTCTNHYNSVNWAPMCIILIQCMLWYMGNSINYTKIIFKTLGGDDIIMNLGESWYSNKIFKKTSIFYLPGKLSSTKPRTLTFHISTSHFLESKCMQRQYSRAAGFCVIAKSKKGICGEVPCISIYL